MRTFLTFALGLLFVTFAACQNETLHDDEFEALLAFGTSVNSASLTWNLNETFCNQEGITCSPLTDGFYTVTSLKLPGYQLEGSISPELGKLANLVELDLGDNRLTGTIPSELGDCSFLETLILSQNELIGVIPTVLAQLTHLNRLDLADNRLAGGTPKFNLSQFYTLLLLGTNELCPIDDYSSVGSNDYNPYKANTCEICNYYSCYNGGTCVPSHDNYTYTCTCPDYYYGDYCESYNPPNETYHGGNIIVVVVNNEGRSHWDGGDIAVVINYDYSAPKEDSHGSVVVVVQTDHKDNETDSSSDSSSDSEGITVTITVPAGGSESSGPPEENGSSNSSDHSSSSSGSPQQIIVVVVNNIQEESPPVKLEEQGHEPGDLEELEALELVELNTTDTRPSNIVVIINSEEPKENEDEKMVVPSTEDHWKDTNIVVVIVDHHGQGEENNTDSSESESESSHWEGSITVLINSQEAPKEMESTNSTRHGEGITVFINTPGPVEVPLNPEENGQEEEHVFIVVKGEEISPNPPLNQTENLLVVVNGEELAAPSLNSTLDVEVEVNGELFPLPL